jgi:hypothetical protein
MIPVRSWKMRTGFKFKNLNTFLFILCLYKGDQSAEWHSCGWQELFQRTITQTQSKIIPLLN